MTIAKGLSSGYQPIGGSIVCDEVAEVVGGAGEFFHGYTYSGHPVAAAVALENLRIMQDEKIVEHVRDVAHPYLKERWDALTDHPMVGEAKLVGSDGVDRADPEQGEAGEVPRGGERRLPDARAVLCQQPDHAGGGRPDDHRAAAGDHAGRDRRADRAGEEVPGRKLCQPESRRPSGRRAGDRRSGAR